MDSHQCQEDEGQVAGAGHSPEAMRISEGFVWREQGEPKLRQRRNGHKFREPGPFGGAAKSVTA